MKHIARFLKGHWFWIFVVLLLLIGQTFCDLGLPTYTGNILNVGIQQKGIPDGVMDTVRQDSLSALELFMTDEQRADIAQRLSTKHVESQYVLSDSRGIAYQMVKPELLCRFLTGLSSILTAMKTL